MPITFTQARGRPAVWWQTQTTVQAANPGARVPRGRAAGPLTIAVDTREKYGWKFAGRPVTLERRALPAVDMLGRLAVRYPAVPIVFAGSRRFAEEWAYRCFGATVGDALGTVTAEEAKPSTTAPSPRIR